MGEQRRDFAKTRVTRVASSGFSCLSVALQLSGAPARRVTGWAASGCGCTETCPVTRDLRASRRLHVPAGRSGRLRGARSLEVSFHRPLVRRAGWRLVPACGNKEVDACRSIDELARSGGYWLEALHRSRIESGDFMGASRPRARSVPRTSVWGRPLGTGVQVGGRGAYLWFAKSSQPASGGSWQSARAALVDHRYTPRRASDPSWCPCSALGRRPLAGDGAYLWSPGTGPFGPLGPPGVGLGVWATIGRVGRARWACRFRGAPLGGRDSQSRLYLGLYSVSGGS